MIASLLLSKDVITIEYLLRLINAIVSENVGVTYMIQNFEKTQILELLLKIIKTEPSDTITRQISIGILQRLSLRSKPRR